MNSSVYAVGLKHYIELRRSNKPPRKHVTKSVRTSKVLEHYSEWSDTATNIWGSRGVYLPKKRTVTRKIPLTVMDFIGGRYLASIKRRSGGPLKCRVGEVRLVEPEIVQGLLQKRP
jgi:hypothetical protein